MSRLEKSRLLFVNYHYIRDAAYPYPGIHPLGMAEFRSELDNLPPGYRFATPAEVESFVLDARPLPGPSIVPTFDDGLMDHWRAASEALDPLGIKGAFFVCSRPQVEERALTVHKIQWLRAHTEPSSFAEEFFAFVPQDLRPASNEPWIGRAERAYKYDTPLAARLKFALNFVLPGELVDAVTSQLFAKRGIDEARFCEETYMSEEHLRSLVERGHVVGVHGHTHAPFSRLGENLLDDVGANVSYLAEATQRAPTWVAYPYGRANAIPDDAELDSLFKRFNLKIGLTLMGTWNLGGESPARLNRINTNELAAILADETVQFARASLS
jgi:peptidoglycan/xylan/chitin deacetylase (PgdA/CDA1 family)